MPKTDPMPGPAPDNYADLNVICKDCGETFLLTAGEQRFLAQKGFTPFVRCKACRDLKRQERERLGHEFRGKGRTK